MSAIRDQNIHKAANFVKRVIPIFIDDAVSLTDAVVFSLVIGHKFEITRVRSFCRTKAGAASFKAKIAAREAVAAGVFTAATEVAQALSATKANLRGSATEALTIELTTDGTGALTSGYVFVELRVRPLNGELGPV